MVVYLLRRTIYSIFLLFLAATAIFFIVNYMPGNPYDRVRQELYEQDPTRLIPQSHWDRLDALLGLDIPVHERYVRWVQAIFTGNFGSSWTIAKGQPVIAVIANRLPYTLLLMMLAVICSLLLSFPAGIFSALRPYSNPDLLMTAFSFFGMAMPPFWFGILLMSVFSGALQWLPPNGIASSGMPADIRGLFAHYFSLGMFHPEVKGNELSILKDGVSHLVMPVFTVSLVLVARWSRMVRTSALEVLGQDFIRTARAKGSSEWRVMSRHVLSNMVIPLITLLALDIPALFTGSFITEIVFGYPGVGRLYVTGLIATDWPVLQGLLLTYAFLIILSNWAADILYGIADPRARVWTGSEQVDANWSPGWTERLFQRVRLWKFRMSSAGLVMVILVAVLVGAAAGIWLSRTAWPVEWVDVHPGDLSLAARQEYLRLAIESYRVNGDQNMALQRWNSLGDQKEAVLNEIWRNPGTLKVEDIYIFSVSIFGTGNR